jgi:hypothetical protein
MVPSRVLLLLGTSKLPLPRLHWLEHMMLAAEHLHQAGNLVAAAPS